MDSGIVKVALNEPPLEVVIVLGDVGWVVPSYLMLILDDPAKPVPTTVTVAPPTPLLELSAMEGVTVKIA